MAHKKRVYLRRIYIPRLRGMLGPRHRLKLGEVERPFAHHPLTAQGIEWMCARWLGVSKAHTLSHTFAVEMERAGAPVSLIRQKLGHSPLAITGRYLSKLTSKANPYAEQLEIVFGIA